MTKSPTCCRAGDDVSTVQDVMSDRQVRRVVIVDGDNSCVGIISQADLARAADKGRGLNESDVARVVEKISEPTVPLGRRQGSDG